MASAINAGRSMGRVSTHQKLTIQSDRYKATEVQETIMSLVADAGFPENAIFGIRLAVEEALANAIRHGNGGDINKKVEITYAVDPDRVSVTICDEGHGFEPDEVPDPTLDENLEKPCGRGVMLMRAYMTDVTFNKRGNCVTMVKERTCPLPATGDDDEDQDGDSDSATTSV